MKEWLPGGGAAEAGQGQDTSLTAATSNGMTAMFRALSQFWSVSSSCSGVPWRTSRRSLLALACVLLEAGQLLLGLGRENEALVALLLALDFTDLGLGLLDLLFEIGNLGLVALLRGSVCMLFTHERGWRQGRPAAGHAETAGSLSPAICSTRLWTKVRLPLRGWIRGLSMLVMQKSSYMRLVLPMR